VDQTILVTGAAGFAGSHLLDLLEQGPTPVVAWRRPEDPLPPGRTGTELAWMSLDLLDRDAVVAAVAQIRPTAVFHCAGAAHVGQSWDRTYETLAVNLLATHHLLRALIATGRRARVLIPSSALVYAMSDSAIDERGRVAPASPYALSKLAQEMAGLRAAREENLPVVVTRSFNHIGPRQHPSFFASSFARQIARIEAGLAEPILKVGNLAARRDLTDVRDTVRAYRALLADGRPGEIYNVCSGHAYRIQEVLDRLLARAHVPVSVAVDPALYRPIDVPVVLGSYGRLHHELGWAPEIPMERTLDDLLEYWRGESARTG
jgi:GDP-4-dehydro-6-deoxy-D-mannose reductase